MRFMLKTFLAFAAGATLQYAGVDYHAWEFSVIALCFTLSAMI